MFSRIRNLAIALFVVWHLTVLAFRNPVDIWSADIAEWFSEAETEADRAGLGRVYDGIDKPTRSYARFVGTEQGWTMFGSPLARSGPWPGLVVVFEDESGTLVTSENEFDPSHFLRLGMARQRKLEDHLASLHSVKDIGGEEAPLWERWVQQTLARWKREHPDDLRPIGELRFVSRRCLYLRPGDPLVHEAIVQTDIAGYTPEGKLIRQ